jgi:hypothetical protein
VASSFDRGASAGMTMVAGAPTLAAAMATACAWLPEENATTPRARSASEIEKMKFAAPRILNAPPRCKFSHLKNASTPASASNVREVMTGVRCAIGRMRSAARRISSRVMTPAPG